MTSTQFKDRHEKIWDLKINLGKALRVDRSDFTVITKTPILLSKFTHEHIVEILTDTALMFAVIGILVRDQAKENLNIESTAENFDELFTEGIDGSCIEPARTAFVDALGDFFPTAKTALSTFLLKIREYQGKTQAKLGDLLPLMDKKIDQQIQKEYQKILDELQRDDQNGTSSPSLPLQRSVTGDPSPSES